MEEKNRTVALQNGRRGDECFAADETIWTNDLSTLSNVDWGTLYTEGNLVFIIYVHVIEITFDNDYICILNYL